MAQRTTAILTLLLLLAPWAGPAQDGDAGWPGAVPPPAPADNPTTPAKVELGRHLFFDSRLSGPGYMSCGTCHRPELGFSDGRPVAIGSTGQAHPRNTPGLANVGYFAVLTWADPAETALETQSSAPLFGREPIVEMMTDSRRAEVLRRFEGDAVYRRLFAAAFPETGGAIDFASIQRALAAFQRTLISDDSPYDRFARDGEAGAMSAAAQRGLALFASERLHCVACHVPPHFTDAATGAHFHNTGLYNLDGAGGLPAGNRGLIDRTGAPGDMGRFRTPSLRNVAVTAPYMHDGSIATLDAVVDAYAAGGRAAVDGARSPLASPLVAGFALTPGERADLIAFLEALTDDGFLTDERLQSPFRYRAEEDGSE
ncbi:MAG: di-heme enzyme [Alphaproteobacteria bacterium]